MCRSAWPRSSPETESSSTSSVAAIANTPSLKVSKRVVPGSFTDRDRRGRGGRSGERRRELAADQPHRLEISVEQVLEHDAVAARPLVGAQTFYRFPDGAD